MAQKPALSSRSSRVDVKEWLGGIRFSGFMAIMMALVVLAVFVLVPSVGTYLEQRQRISSLQHAVKVSQEEVTKLEDQRDKWKDANYIASQARERLYYVRPGEVVFLVDNDVKDAVTAPAQTPVSDKVEKTSEHWMSNMLRSVTEAGLAKNAVPADDAATPTDDSTQIPSP